MLSAALVGIGCDGGGTITTPPAPHLVPGGGIGDGPIAGLLNVYVTDDDTRAPVAGATVRVGASAEPAPCTATTDSTGLAIFDAKTCALLMGKQSVTASATGYAPTTWIGVNGTNITMAVRAVRRPAVDTATASGTIDGWSTVPAPSPGHQTLALIGFSQTRDLGGLANDIQQGTRMVNVAPIGSVSIPGNLCVKNAQVDDCNYRLTTRTGKQAHYGIIVDQDTKGTMVDTDDTFTVIGWALRTGLDFTAGDTASGEALALIADTDMQPLTVSFTGLPAALDALAAYPLLDLGDEGRIPMVLPALDLTHSMTRVPKLTGTLAGARYDLLAQARDSATAADPSTSEWVHDLNPGSTVAVSGWLQPPAGVMAMAGTYSFQAVSGATLHGAEIQTVAGERAWSITIFDGSTSFTLPGLSSDPLPTGMAVLQVSALRIPGIDLTRVSFDDAREQITGIASDSVTFSR
jgi:hypothetical protein